MRSSSDFPDAVCATMSGAPGAMVRSMCSMVPGHSTSPSGACTTSSCSRGTTRETQERHGLAVLAAGMIQHDQGAALDELAAFGGEVEVGTAAGRDDAHHATRLWRPVIVIPDTGLTGGDRRSSSGSVPGDPSMKGEMSAKLECAPFVKASN